MKPGIDYFPLDVTLDEKWELIEAEFGLTGFSVVVKLLQRIYGGQGYYCEWTNEVALLFAKRIGLGGGVVSEIVSASISRGIFDKSIYDKYQILTSAGIQKRYFEAVSRRKGLKIDQRYLLVPYTQNSENVCKNERNVDIFSKNADIFEQSKVEKSKDITHSPRVHARGKNQNVILTDEEYDLLISKGIPADYIDYFSERLDSGKYSYPHHYDAILKWWQKDRAKAPWNAGSARKPQQKTESSFDTDEFFQAALKRSKKGIENK